MALTGRICSIKLEPNTTGVRSMANSLAAKDKTRFPLTGVLVMPKKELNGHYRTGLDDKAPWVEKIVDPEERKAEKERLIKLRLELEEKIGLEPGGLLPNAKFWNYSLYTDQDRQHVQPFKLVDGENVFNFKDAFQEVAFRWLSVHPYVAPSYESFQRGDSGPQVIFYVHEEETENKRAYDRKMIINKAIVKLDSMSLEDRKKVGKLLGLPITDNSSDTLVYNLVDNLLKQTEFKDGQYKGMSTVNMFHQFADMSKEGLSTKHLVREAIDFNIYRKIENAIYEGELKVADTEAEVAKLLTDKSKQADLIALQEKVKAKKLATL